MLITGFVLLLVGAYYMGGTAHFAQVNGYYLQHYPPSAQDVYDAKLMYTGALVYLIFLVGILVLVIILV